MNRFTQIIVSSLAFLFLALPVVAVISPVAVSAQAQGVCAEDENTSFLGFPTWYKYLSRSEVDGNCELNFSVTQDAGKVLLAVFEIILRIGGLAAVGFIIFGGFQYLISQGEPDRTKGAKSTILNAVIGLVIALTATAIVNLIARNI
jgi:hypothetical protein